MASSPRYEFDYLRVDEVGSVRVVTIDNPEQMNAFSEPLHDEYAALWPIMARDAGARAVVLTGAGKAFSAGGSIDDFELFRTDFEARRKTLRNARRLVDDMLSLHLPVIAAVNGPAVGLGCTLASLCDIVFIADSTYLADPHVTVALVAGDGSAVTWPFMTSILRVKQYLLTGDRIPAQTAVELGLANFAVPVETVVAEATAFALRLAALPPQAIQDTKQTLNQMLRQASVNVLGFGLMAESQSHDTAEYREVPEKFRARSR